METRPPGGGLGVQGTGGVVMMIPEIARNRWCPFARVPVMDHEGEDLRFAANRGEALRESTCIVQRCMAWRWAEASNRPEEERFGYCGLAGKPEELA